MATLVTGGLGYIGAALTSRLLGSRCGFSPVIVLDNFFSTARENAHEALTSEVVFVEGDVARQADIDRAFSLLGPVANQPHTVFHLAAQPSASVAANNPEVTERTNLVGARNVLEAADAAGANVVFASSFRIYGDELWGQAVDETCPYGRVNDLSHLSKAYVEQLGRMIGVPFISVRLGITYGLSPCMKDAEQFLTVPNLFCMRAANGLPLEVRSNRAMAFIHVADAVQALILSAEILGASSFSWHLVNAAPEVETVGRIANSVRLLMSERGVATQISTTSFEELAHEEWFTVSSRLSECGFQAQHRLIDALGDVVDHFRARQ